MTSGFHYPITGELQLDVVVWMGDRSVLEQSAKVLSLYDWHKVVGGGSERGGIQVEG